MKKALVILLAFALVFGLVFSACSNGTTGSRPPADNTDNTDNTDNSGVREKKVVFDMSKDAGIQALTVGTALVFGAGDAGNPIKPLVRAAEDNHATYTPITVPGGTTKGLKFDTKDNWGIGIDLQDKAFGFFAGNDTYAEGDKITVTGKITKLASGGRIQLNRLVGNEYAIGNKAEAAGDFKLEVTLTDADVTAIKGTSAAALRIEARGTGNEVEIHNIVIEGYRLVEVKQLEKPVITIDGTMLKWDKIEGASGYKVRAVKDGTTEVIAVTTAAATATSYDFANSTLPPTKYTETAVKYSITLVAAGTGGVSDDSDPSDPEEFTKQPPPAPPLVKVKIGGAEKDAELYAVGGSFENITEGGKVIGYTFTKVEEYAGSYAYLKVDLGTGKSLKDYSQVKVDYQGVSGDIAYKDLELRVSATEFSGSLTGSPVNKKRFDDWASINPSNGSANGKLELKPGPQMNSTAEAHPILKIDPDLAAAITGNEVFVVFHLGTESNTIFKISNIEFVLASTSPFTHTVYFITDKTDRFLLAYTENVMHNTTASAPTLPDSNAKMAENYTTFVAGGTISGWKKESDDSAWAFTSNVTNDLILYAVK
jgi:hypothetical protein